MAKITININPDDYRAFELIVPDPGQWVADAVQNKIRKCLIYVAEEVTKNGLLDDGNYDVIAELLKDEKAILKAPKDYSENVKRELAKRTYMKTRKQRDKDEEDALNV